MKKKQRKAFKKLYIAALRSGFYKEVENKALYCDEKNRLCPAGLAFLLVGELKLANKRVQSLNTSNLGKIVGIDIPQISSSYHQEDLKDFHHVAYCLSRGQYKM